MDVNQIEKHPAKKELVVQEEVKLDNNQNDGVVDHGSEKDPSDKSSGREHSPDLEVDSDEDQVALKFECFLYSKRPRESKLIDSRRPLPITI